MRSAICLGALAFLALRPPALDAQAVRGRVVDAEVGRPAVGAVVTLMSSEGASLVAAPAPGTYRIRVELVGYRTSESPPITVPARDTVSLDVRLPLRRVQLEGVRVQGETPCHTRPDRQPRVVAI